MRLFPFFYYLGWLGLILQTRAAPLSQQGYSITPLRDLHNTCDPDLRSICALGGKFGNHNENFEEMKPTLIKRADNEAVVHFKTQNLLNEMQSLKHSLFEATPPAIFQKWQSYLVSLIDLAESALLRTQELGFCGEATAASIIESLKKQLNTGERERIQYITLRGQTPSGSPLNHAFAIYNSSPIPAGPISNRKLARLLRHLTVEDLHHPIIICDSWVQFKGLPKDWEKQFQREVSPPYTEVIWEVIEIEDLSIPSLREGLNSEQRHYLKRRMMDVFSGTPIFFSSNTKREGGHPNLR